MSELSYTWLDPDTVQEERCDQQERDGIDIREPRKQEGASARAAAKAHGGADREVGRDIIAEHTASCKINKCVEEESVRRRVQACGVEVQVQIGLHIR